MIRRDASRRVCGRQRTTDDDDDATTMSMRRRPGGARKMKAFSRVETIATAAAFDRAMKKRDQLVLVEFVSVRGSSRAVGRG